MRNRFAGIAKRLRLLEKEIKEITSTKIPKGQPDSSKKSLRKI